ncbi:MAG: OsmC family protein [Bacteroidota bacterium]
MKSLVNVLFKENMHFEAEIDGYKINIDADPEFGGKHKGPKPKPLMLVALGGCTGMDVVSILRKMRVDFESLNIIVEGDQTEEQPKRYTSMHIIYEIKGKNLPKDNVEKAVNLSQEKYCGVSAVYKEVIKLTHEIKYL